LSHSCEVAVERYLFPSIHVVLSLRFRSSRLIFAFQSVRRATQEMRQHSIVTASARRTLFTYRVEDKMRLQIAFDILHRSNPVDYAVFNLADSIHTASRTGTRSVCRHHNTSKRIQRNEFQYIVVHTLFTFAFVGELFILSVLNSSLVPCCRACTTNDCHTLPVRSSSFSRAQPVDSKLVKGQQTVTCRRHHHH
jgi:hypothetical protein